MVLNHLDDYYTDFQHGIIFQYFSDMQLMHAFSFPFQPIAVHHWHLLIHGTNSDVYMRVLAMWLLFRPV